MKVNLKTPYYDKCDFNKPWNDYPRPNLKRESYMSLNGYWDYKISNDNFLDNTYQGKICVPFPVESLLSQVNKRLKNGEYLIYRRFFKLDNSFVKNKVFLNFEAVDQICDVYLNSIHLGNHIGGYLPFSFEIKKYLKENNELVIVVKDDLNHFYPYGKQKNKSGGMWYTPCSGIWQSVWLESVNHNYIENIKITPNIDSSSIDLEIFSTANEFEVTILDKDEIINQFITKKRKNTIKIDGYQLWSPENPCLYDLKIKTNNDEINSYFAMRKVSIGKNNNNYACIMLNNKPYFNNGLLDQGYYSDGLFTPATIDGYIDDIKKMKELGFNTLRKHIKIEPRIFYYLCDKMGMLVWQDMVNNSDYNFIKDTVFPTLKIYKKSDENAHKNIISRDIFINHSKETIMHLYNYPCIVLWTIFNEGWGQFCSEKLYEMAKKWDSTRIIDTTSGWFDYSFSDVNSLHIYFKDIKFQNDYRITAISEFGGYGLRINNHTYNLSKSYGYKNFKSQEDFEKAFIDLYTNQVIPAISKGLSATIYTQVSDVEDEINGLLTYDRKVLKVNSKIVKEIMHKVKFDDK